MLTNYARVVQFYSAPLACFADALDNRTPCQVYAKTGERRRGTRAAHSPRRRLHRRTHRRQSLRFRPHQAHARLGWNCGNHSLAGQPADPDLVGPAAIQDAAPGRELLLRPQAVQGRGHPLQQAGGQLLRHGEPGLLDHRDQEHQENGERAGL